MATNRHRTYVFPASRTTVFFEFPAMKTIVIVATVACLDHLVAQTEASPQMPISELMNQFGGQESMLRIMNSTGIRVPHQRRKKCRRSVSRSVENGVMHDVVNIESILLHCTIVELSLALESMK
ncbi:hypothetical protein ANTPLA_LOCUS5903 [Anthophora plagiata]